jgi:hypothetical protein
MIKAIIAIRTPLCCFLLFTDCFEEAAAWSYVIGCTEFSDAPQQYRQYSVPAGFSFLQTGQTSHKPSGGSGEFGFCPSSEFGIDIKKYYL